MNQFSEDKPLSQVSETLLEQALELRRQGKTLDEVVGRFPGEGEELRELLLTAEMLKEGKSAILPDETLVQRILSSIEAAELQGQASVTETAEHRSIESSNPESRTSLATILEHIMKSRWSIIAPVGAVVILGGLFLVNSLLINQGSDGTSSEVAMKQSAGDVEALEQTGDDLNAYIQDESVATDVNQMINEIAGTAPARTSGSASSFLNASVIDQDRQALANDDAAFNGFVASEAQTQEFDGVLNSF